jgi:hypothetical protein
MTRHARIVRLGRMARWQRLASYIVFGACFASGLVWFVLLDLVGLQPPQVVLWWIGHGVTSFITVCAIGAALPQHVVVAWRHRRNVVLGVITLIVVTTAAVTALLLLYGPEETHLLTHWAHVGVGLVAVVAFVWHVLTGRRSQPKRLHGKSRASATGKAD